MYEYEKRDIYIPEDTAITLESDAMLFEILKNDGKINKNDFLNRLISGYYYEYTNGLNKVLEKIKNDLIDAGVSPSKCEKTSRAILSSFFSEKHINTNKKQLKKISIKFQLENEVILEMIKKNSNQYLYESEFFRNMILSYCEKPLYIRERIIFKKNYDYIEYACKKGFPISFSTSASRIVHDVIPYRIVFSKEELSNYLLCGQINPETKEMEACSYRLNRIKNPVYCTEHLKLDDYTKACLDITAKTAPQFVNNPHNKICVRLTSEGQKSYSRIYSGRPFYDSRVHNEDDTYDYYFSCAEDQAFFYFRKFEGNKAEILYPDSLRERIIQSFKNNLETYERN